jgi:FixJ family two-component response regulator
VVPTSCAYCALLQKPYKADELLEAVRRALDTYRSEQEKFNQLDDIRNRLESLQPDEYGVMKLMIEGKPNKSIASELEISMRTVDRRRNVVLQKMGVSSAPEVARLVALLEASEMPA